MYLSQQPSGFAPILGFRNFNVFKKKNELSNLNKKLIAFTLAEVLITLVIIGIVAALTIPVVVQKYKKKVVETKLLKAYATLNDAFSLSEVENGSMSTWNYQDKSAANYFNKYLMPYLKVSSTNLKETKLSDMGYKDGIKIPYRKTTKNQFPSSNKMYNLTLNDGTVVIFRTLIYTACYSDGTCQTSAQSTNYDQEIYVDINGLKEPNTIGRDIFVFTIRISDNKLSERFKAYFLEDIVYYKNQYGADFAAGLCQSDARYCAAVIQTNDWRIPDNYPFEL